MASGTGNKQAREQRERARRYKARAQVNAAQQRRRRRDDVLGAVVGAVLIVAVLGMQTLYFTAGPGAPTPVPTRTATPAATPGATASPAPATTTSTAP